MLIRFQKVVMALMILCLEYLRNIKEIGSIAASTIIFCNISPKFRNGTRRVCLCGCVLMSACVCVAACWWVCVCVCGCMTLNCLSGCLSCKMLLNSIAKIETKYLQCDTEREKLLDLWKGDGSRSFKQVTKSVRSSFFRSRKIVKIFLRTSLSFFHNFFC